MVRFSFSFYAIPNVNFHIRQIKVTKSLVRNLSVKGNTILSRHLFDAELMVLSLIKGSLHLKFRHQKSLLGSHNIELKKGTKGFK